MRIALLTALAIGAAFLLPAVDPPNKPDVVSLLQKQIADHPGAPEPNVYLVEILLRAERFDEADDVIKVALAANSQASDLHRAHGDLLFREGHIIDADAEYKAAFNLDKNNARAIYGISRTFSVAGLRARAAGLVRAAHQLAPEDEEINAAFYALDTAGAAALWDGALKNPRVLADPDHKQYAETQLARAKLLNGKHEFELASPYRTYQLPYRVLYDGKRPTGMGATILINGVKSELRLDTGASGVTVSSGFAAKAGIQRIGGSKLGGIGNAGSVDTWTGYAERMQIGDIEFQNIIVDVKEKGSVDDSGGLLGTDIFKRFLVRINFRAGRIELDPLPGTPWDGFTPVDRYAGPEVKEFAQTFQVHHMLLIPTLVSEKTKSDQTSTLFLVDTGATFNNISTNLAPTVTKLRNNNYMTVKGISGKVKMVYQADQVVLQFASFRQTNLGLTSLDMTNISRSASVEVSGILGLPLLSLFESFTIDYRDAGIKFVYSGH